MAKPCWECPILFTIILNTKDLRLLLIGEVACRNSAMTPHDGGEVLTTLPPPAESSRLKAVTDIINNSAGTLSFARFAAMS